MTSLATEIGWRTPTIAATAPAVALVPSMIDASISSSPALFRWLPRPALYVGSSSSMRTTSSTTSSAEAPFRSASKPSVSGSAQSATVCGDGAVGMFHAPPCIASAKLKIVPVAEARGSRTHPGRHSRPTRGFEDREGHRAPSASGGRVDYLELTLSIAECHNARPGRGCSSAGRAHDWQS